MELPFYVEERRVKGEMEFWVSPLFMPEMVRHGELLSRVMAKVMQDLREFLAKAAEGMRHDELLPWMFCPEVKTEVVEASLLLRHTTIKCRLMVAEFAMPGREGEAGKRMAFSPAVPGVWFDVAKGEALRERAVDVLTGYFKGREKEEGPRFVPPKQMEQFVRGWVTTAEMAFSPAQKYVKPGERLMAALMGEEKMSGQRELQKVARKIDALYPDELNRAVLREAEVGEMMRLMQEQDRRPVLLVGPPMVGKTAIVHEYVYRRRKAMRQPAEYRGTLWLLSPQRLISGMMYAGQWENRLLAILDHMKEMEQVLYLDDLPGFYHAGISAQSNLSAAQVLRPYIERREVRVVAEITPESLRVLQERDRGFADLFHVLPVREPAEGEARRVLIAVVRQLEGMHRCRFGVEVLPTVMELQGRYVRELAMPGKGAVFLDDLAAKYARADVGRNQVLQEFHDKSGLAVGFLDRFATLERKAVEEAIGRHVIGQTAAVQAMADVVSIGKAQLNDPGRPLGTFLFLGPTGVGKTQAAKALAAYLFGGEERLLRFDMNEFVDAYSAQRLVGTWTQPEGLLTSAVRRRPFGVILLDEIEKADPAVFDLLLQVLGEGRLTDSLGRTSDFANTIVIMTSNLGVREAEMRFGFGNDAGADRAEAFRRAAQAFFRPEFYNRIDRIVPFERLSRAQTETIAQGLIEGVLKREGLRQRKCMLSVMPAAMARIVDAGYSPELGARALKRAIERQLTAPVAGQLAAMEPGLPTVVKVYPAGEDGIGVQVSGLHYAQREAEVDVSDPAATIERIDAALDRLHAAMQKIRPKGRVTMGDVSAEQVRYFAMKEQFEKVERLLERFERGEERRAAGKKMGAARATMGRQKDVLRKAKVNFRAMLAAHDMRQYLHEMVETAETVGGSLNGAEAAADALRESVRELALLEAMAAGKSGRVVLWVRPLSGQMADIMPVFQFYMRLGWKVEDVCPTLWSRAGEAAGVARTLGVVLEHPAAEAIGQAERGVQMVLGKTDEMYPAQVVPVVLREGEDALSAVAALAKRERTWQEDLAAGRATLQDDPLAPGRILRMFDLDVIDFRSGLIGTQRGENRAMVLAGLPLPAEVEEE